jgi:hypothetical protein
MVHQYTINDDDDDGMKRTCFACTRVDRRSPVAPAVPLALMPSCFASASKDFLDSAHTIDLAFVSREQYNIPER